MALYTTHPNAKSDTLMPIVQNNVIPDYIVYSHYWWVYNVLGVSELTRYNINNSKLFPNAHNHTDGIEHFWNPDKRYLRKFNGVPSEHFPSLLKDYE